MVRVSLALALVLASAGPAHAQAGGGASAGAEGPPPPAAARLAPPGPEPGPPPAKDASVPVAAIDPPGAPEGSTGETPRPLEVGANGYLDVRMTGQRVRTDRLVPGTDTPAVANLTEANAQLKLRWGERGFALADTSFFYQAAGGTPGPEHDLAAYRPLAVISELYGSYTLGEHANLTLGKKRVVWGPGFFLNPSDLLNPPKDPTDPSLQRAGAWLARLEMPFEKLTLTVLGAAKVLHEYGGVPSDVLVYRDYDVANDHRVHGAAAGRLYALVADTDVNLVYWFTNLYADDFERKSRTALTFSRLLGKALEIHGEGLLQRGSSRLYVDPACTVDLPAALGCVASGRPVAAESKRNASGLVAHTLVGARYTFEDDAMLGADYLYFSDGYSAAEWRDFLRGLRTAQQARDAGLPVPPGLGPGPPAAAGTPQKFTFQPLRRHYLFLNYQKPRIKDDFTFTLTLLASLHDGSGQAAPQIAWQLREWVTLTLAAFAPLPALHPTTLDGAAESEFGLAPADWRGLLSVRLFY